MSRILLRDDLQAVDVIELFGLLDQHNFCAELFEPAAVCVEISPESQDSDGHFA